MSWSLHDHEIPAMEDLKKASDRAAAIIAGALVEARLQSAIQSRFQRDAKIEGDMFRSTGPLGTFSAKIKLSFLLGVVTQEAHRELETIKGHLEQ